MASAQLVRTVSAAALLQSASTSGSDLKLGCSFCPGGRRNTRLNRNVHSTTVRYRPVCVSASDNTETTTKADVDILPSGEWPENFSMLNYEDLSAHYAPDIFKKEAQPNTMLADIMSKKVWSAFTDTTLEEVSHHFEDVTGVPVVNKDLVCVGVLSKKDVMDSDRSTKVGDVMSTPAITITAGETVKDAAILMLREKVHRLPVVNESHQLVGIVTRTDIFTALEGLPLRD